MIKKVIKIGLSVAIPIFLIVLLLLAVASDDEEDNSGNNEQITGLLSSEVLSYRSLVEKYARENGIEEYVDYLLAIMMVESGGRGNDVMASSESMGLPVGTLMPEESIKAGCKYFAEAVRYAESKGCDIWTAVQGYNFGITGYVNHIANHGKIHKIELAEKYSRDVVAPSLGNTTGEKYKYSDPIAIAYNGGYLYRNGGNFFYAEKVKFYIGGGVDPGEAGTVAPEERLNWLFPSGVPKSAAEMQPYLTVITVPIIDTKGTADTMQLTVHRSLASTIKQIFEEMKKIKFPVRKSDTAGYVWRQMASSASISHHSYGCVIDLNWQSNPMVGVTSGSYLPGVDRYSVTPQVVQIWKKHGFYWGGDWSKSKDYMHFTYTNH